MPLQQLDPRLFSVTKSESSSCCVRNDCPDVCNKYSSMRNFPNELFSIVSMALRTAISRLKPGGPPPYNMFKYQHPPVFKKFVVNFVRELTNDDRAALMHWCIDLVPGSKLDVDVVSDRVIYQLIEFLLSAKELSFNDMSLLKEFLSSVGRIDVLQTLERVELVIFIGGILEDYVKGLHQGSCKKSSGSYANIVELLLKIRRENQELINIEQFIQVNDDVRAVEILDGDILSSQLSWPAVISSLVVIGELFASLSPDEPDSGHYVCLFSKTRASEFLSEWIHENGGLKAFKEIVRKKQKIARNCSGLSSIEESLKESIELLGNRVDV